MKLFGEDCSIENNIPASQIPNGSTGIGDIQVEDKAVGGKGSMVYLEAVCGVADDSDLWNSCIFNELPKAMEAVEKTLVKVTLTV